MSWQTGLDPIAGVLIVLLGIVTSVIGCDTETYPVDSQTSERVVSELENRSFREADPSRDGDPRKAVILDFFTGFKLWAQYAEGGHAIAEWQITSADYRVEWTGDFSEIVLIPVDPTSQQQFPSKCSNCIPSSGVSVSIRGLFNEDDIEFKINDPNNALPSPFPVFKSWTRFPEDEYMN